MSKLGAALAAFAVLIACNRSAQDREAPASETTREQQEIAGATQRPPPDTVFPTSPGASGPRASTTQARRHPAAPLHKRRVGSTHHRAAERPDSAPVPAEVSAQPTRTRDSSRSSASVASSDTVGYSSYPGTESPPAPAARVVAAGTVIPVSLEDSINSRHDTWGKLLTGKVMQNVTGPNGEVLVRAGTPLRLTVSRLRPGRGKGKGEIEIQADSITVQGRPRKLEAKVESVPYELRGRGVTGEEAAKVGVGAAGGAVVGGVVTGKTKGAVIGGVVGAAAGAALASQTAAKDVVVAARTPVRVVLTAPLVIR